MMPERVSQHVEVPLPDDGAITPRIALAVLGHLLVHGLPPAAGAQSRPAGVNGARLGPWMTSQGGGAIFSPGPGPLQGPGELLRGRPFRPNSLLAARRWGTFVAPRPQGPATTNAGLGTSLLGTTHLPVRLASPNGSTHPARLVLLRVAEEQPGLNIHEIARRLQLSRGATRYHLRGLIREGRIVTQRQGHHLLHFRGSMPPLQRRAVALLRIASVRSLVEALVRDSLVQPSALARQLGFSARSVRRGIKMLIRVGLARQDVEPGGKSAQRVALHPDARIAWVLWCKGSEEGPSSRPTSVSPAWVMSLETLFAYLVSHLLG